MASKGSVAPPIADSSAGAGVATKSVAPSPVPGRAAVRFKWTAGYGPAVGRWELHSYSGTYVVNDGIILLDHEPGVEEVTFLGREGFERVK